MSNDQNNPASPPSPLLTYSTNLWVHSFYNFHLFCKKKKDKFEMLQRFSSDKRKLIEDFMNILQERVEIEETYAKGLEKLSNMLNNFMDKG